LDAYYGNAIIEFENSLKPRKLMRSNSLENTPPLYGTEKVGVGGSLSAF